MNLNSFAQPWVRTPDPQIGVKLMCTRLFVYVQTLHDQITLLEKLKPCNGAVKFLVEIVIHFFVYEDSIQDKKSKKNEDYRSKSLATHFTGHRKQTAFRRKLLVTSRLKVYPYEKFVNCGL